EVPEQRGEVLDPRMQGVVVARDRVRRVVGLVGQPHADVVGDDAAVAPAGSRVRQSCHQRAPVIAPRRVAVDHDHDLAVARTLVEIGHPDAGTDLETLGTGGITRKMHGDAWADSDRHCRTGAQPRPGTHRRRECPAAAATRLTCMPRRLPQIAMSSPTSAPPYLDEDRIERLADLLDRRAVPFKGFNLEALDGFLTALAVSPSAVQPEEWQPV